MTNSNSHPPFSIVLTGGGMRCSWSGGFLIGLHDIGLLPKTILTTSGSAGNAVYIATGQSDMIKRIWVEHLSGNRFINFWRFKKIIDIDFLVDEVIAKKEPVDLPALKKSTMQVVIACFNLTKQKVDYFSNEDITLSVLKATKAMPVVYGKKILINDNLYRDQAFSMLDLIRDDKEILGEKIIYIDLRETNHFIKTISKFLDPPLPEDFKLEKETQKYIFTISPKEIEAHLLSSSKEVLEKSFDQGYQYAISQEAKIREYLSK